MKSLVVISFILTIGSVVPHERVCGVQLQKHNHGYCFKIGIGNPPQQFKRSFDLCLDSFTVQSKNCSITDRGCLTVTGKKFDNRKSSTYQMDGTLISCGHARAYVSRDTVYVNETTEMSNEAGNSGDFGLPFGAKCLESLSPNVGACNFLKDMKNQGLIEKRIFTTYFNRGPDARAGEVQIGKDPHDESKEALAYVDATPRGCWQFKMDQILVDNQPAACENGCQCIIKTTEEFIKGPKDKIRNINKLIGAKKSLLSGLYTVDCSRIDECKSVTFVINGKPFEFLPRDFIVKKQLRCYSIFAEHDSNVWNIGTYGMGIFDILFDCDENRLGFGRATRRN